MESLEVNLNFWRDKKVFLTGHTGFKGSWLSLWLQSLGAVVTGYALNPKTQPSLFELANVAKNMYSIIGDIRDLDSLKNAMKETNAIIGGEGNGGVIYPESHYGRDALVGIALFLTHLAKKGQTVSVLRASYPAFFISKNKITLTPDMDIDALLAEVEKRYEKQPHSTIDGLKIEFDKQWVHLRRSNTEPIIRIYSEGSSETIAENLAQKIISDIKEILRLTE